VLAFADQLNFFADELARLRRGCFAFAFVFACALDGARLGHNNLSIARVGGGGLPDNPL
jgi:hypothetical protein